MRYSLVADHYQHLALIAIVAAIAAGLAWWHESVDVSQVRAAPAVVALILIATLSFLAWEQAGLYRNSIRLYSR